MTPERWATVQDLLERALELEPSARSLFLDEACRDDRDLRDEVDSLISAQASLPPDFLESRTVPGASLGTGSRAHDTSAPSPSLARGDVIAERFVVRRLLGRGGMGEVYEAHDRELGIDLALKVLHGATARRGARTLKREVLAARRVTHPGACRMFDLGWHRSGDVEHPFITMELLDGVTLAARIRERGRLPIEEALPIAAQIADALDAAHAAGVVHSDLKPANVLLVAQPRGERVVVTDFGIAEILSSAAETHAGVSGTLPYVAPERMSGARPTPASDLYSLGVLLHEMIAGGLPDSTASIDLDPTWEAVIFRLLRPQPEQRFASATAVARALAGETSDEPATLPRRTDPFIGRSAELADIGSRLARGARLVTVTGPPGVGKTRLVQEHARRTAGRWTGGAWFCDLSDARGSDDILSAMARCLDLSLVGGDAATVVGDAIRARGRCLILFDNFEQLLEHAPETIQRWLARADDARFLVTSRERLRLDGESVLTLSPLGEDAGVELFTARARELARGFAPDESSGQAIRAVVRLVDGLPLAIELAAARTRMLSPAQIEARLQDRFRVLARNQDPGGRQDTLRAAIDWSWDLLLPTEKLVLAQCAVFEGGFTIEAAEAIVDTSGAEGSPWVTDVLQALLEKNLLMGPSQAAGRFHLYVSLHDYTRERLRESPDGGAETEARHGRWYGADPEKAHRDPRWRERAADLANIATACRRAVARGDADTAVSTLQVAWNVLVRQGPMRAAISLATEVLSLQAMEPRCRVAALDVAGMAARNAGRTDDAEALLQEAHALCLASGNKRVAARVLNHLCAVSLDRGQMEQALDQLNRSLALHVELADRAGEASQLHSIAYIEGQLGRLDAAWAHGERSLELAREVGAECEEQHAWIALGTIDLMRGRSVEAARSLTKAAELARGLGDRITEGHCIANLGSVASGDGRHDEALPRFEEALAIYRGAGNRRGEGVMLSNLAITLLELNRMEEARVRLDEVLALARVMGDRGLEGTTQLTYGTAAFKSGRPHEALEHHRQADALLREVKDPWRAGQNLCEMGSAQASLGRFDDARAAYAEGAEILRNAGFRLYHGLAVVHWGDFELQAGDRRRARELLDEARRIASDCQASTVLASELAALAAALDDVAPEG